FGARVAIGGGDRIAEAVENFFGGTIGIFVAIKKDRISGGWRGRWSRVAPEGEFGGGRKWEAAESGSGRGGKGAGAEIAKEISSGDGHRGAPMSLRDGMILTPKVTQGEREKI